MILLIYQFFVFEIAFGNALADQKRYASFRSELLAGDLSELMSEVGHNETEAQIQGSIGLSIVTEHVAKQYPITYSLISDDACGLSEHNWSVYTFILNYRQDIDFTFVEYDGFKWGVKSSRSSERNDFEEQHSSVAYDVSSMEKLKDSFYHTIYSDGTTFVIVLKQDSDSR